MMFCRLRVLGIVATVLTLSAPAYGQGGEGSNFSEGPVSTLDLAYDLYIGGIPFGQAGMTVRIEGDRYTATSTLETQGIANRLWRSKIETAANGVIGDTRVRPNVYDSFSTRRSGRRQEVTLQFDEDGPSSVFAVPTYNDPEDFRTTEEQKHLSLDPLSALIFLTSSHYADDSEPCNITAPIFDGRRRYDVGFSFVRRTDVSMDNGIYSGPALICEVHYVQIAGYRQTLIEQGKQVPRIYAWIAALPSRTNPDRPFMVPLRLWSETEYGLIVAVANTVKLDGVDPVHAGSES